MIGVRMKMYEHEHGKKMTTKAIAAMLSTMLYYRRFFPVLHVQHYRWNRRRGKRMRVFLRSGRILREGNLQSRRFRFLNAPSASGQPGRLQKHAKRGEDSFVSR